MADNAPAAKRAKRDKFTFDSSSDDDNDSVMDTEINFMTSDSSENDWQSQSSKHGDGNLNRNPLVLKVPRGKTPVPEQVLNPGSALISDKRQNEISPEHFKALSQMPLDHICIFAETSKGFKEIALKFFAMKYRNLNLGLLINPSTGKYSLDSASRMLRLFGHLIWSLDLNLERLDNPQSCVDLLAVVRNHRDTLGWLSI